MRKPNNLVLLLLLFLCTVVRGQQQPNTDGKQTDLSKFFSAKEQLSETQSEGVYYLQLHFLQVPDKNLLDQLARMDIRLLSYRNGYTYLAAIPANIDPARLERLPIEAISKPVAANKLSLALKNQEIPQWASAEAGSIDVAISFFLGTPVELVNEVLGQYGIEELYPRRKKETLIIGRMAEDRLAALATQPVIAAIDIIQEPDQLLNFENRNVQKVNTIQSTLPGNLNLRGHGVTIGVGDGGELGEHVDFAGRVINKANGTYSSFGSHGDHVAGIIGGAGILNPRHRGMAPESELIIEKTSLVTYYSEDYYNNHGMVLTNNSYGTTSNCDINGTYNYSSQSLDWQMREFPDMLHVFAAGNNGWETCGSFPKSYHTVLRYYQAAKNVLTVGNVKDNRSINPNSSRGPVQDGRLKPEICGVGTNVMSTGRDNNYWNATGTSMATPSVVGTMALMYERYRELNGGANPQGALMKVIACNTAEDLGNAGPDFTYGYGLINAMRAIEVIEADQFTSGSLEHGQTNTQQIDVPNGVAQVKIMLYWHDKEFELDGDKALVNDLDLEVSAPTGSHYLPWVLDPDPARVEDLAVRGVDRLNNIEQVTIDQPAAGSYTIDIKGFEVPVGPQEYFITYEFVYSEVTLIFPTGGEKLDFGKIEKIQWDAEPMNTHTFHIEWSADNGNTWTTLRNNIDANSRYINWTTPTDFTDQALVRVSKVGTSISDESDAAFGILGPPSDLTAESVCAGHVELNWTHLDYATSYEVMMFRGEEMVTVETVVANTHTITSGLNIGEKYWFAVKAIGSSGIVSERTEAVYCIPEISTPCNWENDGLLYCDAVEFRGRYNTSSALTAAESISVVIKNLGNNELQTVDVYYQVGEDVSVKETFTGSIPVGEQTTYTFQQQADFSEPGEYEVNAWVEIPGDTHPENDYLSDPIIAVQLGHSRTSLPKVEDFDNLDLNHTYLESRIGPDGLLSWDLDLGPGSMAFTEPGEQESVALTIGNTGSDDDEYLNRAILNLELSNLHETTEEVYLILSYKSNLNVFQSNRGQGRDENILFIRGSEADEWVNLMSFPVDKNWNRTPSIDINRVLTSAGQSFSATTQIMFQQQGAVALTLDNISLSTPSRLPVKMDTFSARRDGEEAILEWTTASEEGNDFFLIEAAEGVDGVMQGAFEVIGKIPGQGFSDQAKDYVFRDSRERKRGDCYYRLKQVDFGGHATNSEFRVVHFPILEEEIVLYPNPFIDQLQLYYESEEEQTVTFQVVNANGQLVKEYQEQFQKGRYEVPVAIDPNLPGGLYSIQVLFADQTIQSFRVYKARD